MKKFTEIFGFILAIIIAFSAIGKVQHYPGSGFGITISLGILLLPFLILFAIIFYKEKKSIIPLIFCGFSGLIYLTGFLFLIQHWPGGSFFLFAGLIMLLITLIVISIIELTKQPIHRKYSVITLSFIMMSVSLIYAASFRTVGRSVLDGLITANNDLTRSSQNINDFFENSYMKYSLSNPNKSTIYSELRDKSNEVFNQIEAVKRKLAVYANGNSEFTDYSTINGLDIVDISNVYMIEHGVASELKNQIETYKKFIIANDSVFNLKEQVHYFLNTQDPPPTDVNSLSWEHSKFLNVPVICAISNLSAIQLNIRNCEVFIISRLE